MSRLSVVIIAKDEEHDLPDALASAVFADEIVVVVDARTSDATEAVARAAGAQVHVHEWPGFSAQWNRAIDYATGDWVMVLAADERIEPALAAEIRALVDGGATDTGYYVPRKNYFLGRWIAHSGWYPQYELRLFRAGLGRMDNRLVHERLVVQGSLGYLHGALVHYSHRDLSSYIENMNTCTTLEAQEALALGMRFTWGLPLREIGGFLRDAAKGPYTRKHLYFLLKDHFKNRVAAIWSVPLLPIATFVRMWVLLQGYRDGWNGFILAVMSSVYVAVKYFKLWDLRRAAAPGDAS